MSRYRSVLRRLSRGEPVETVREELDLRDDVVRGMIESMLREGHLKEFGCEGESCSACPMSESCPMGDIQGPRSYMVTSTGQEYLLQAQQAGD